MTVPPRPDPSLHTEPSTVTVRGRAGVTALTDRAEVTITARIHHPEQQVALHRRETAVELARTVLSRLPLLQQKEERLDESTSHDRSHIASWSCQLRAESGDPGAMEQLLELIARLAGSPDCQVTGPDWTLSPLAQQAAHRQALRQATTAAQEQAETIIDALGGQLSGITQVRSVAAKNYQVTGTETESIALAAYSGQLPERTLELSGEPELQEVTAEVEVSFTAVF